MKKRLNKCDKCNDQTIHSIKKRMGTNKNGSYMKRTVDKCNTCGKTIIKNTKNGTYIKTLGGNSKTK